jgi:hypothetical protein
MKALEACAQGGGAITSAVGEPVRAASSPVAGSTDSLTGQQIRTEVHAHWHSSTESRPASNVTSGRDPRRRATGVRNR